MTSPIYALHELSLEYPGKFECTSVIDRGNALELFFESIKNPNVFFFITFVDVIYYKNVNESLWAFLPDSNVSGIGKDLYTNTFFLITNSSFVVQHQQKFKNLMLKHFSCVGIENIVEVVTFHEPIIGRTAHAS